MTQIEICNMLYEHRKNVCELMSTEKMSAKERDRLYWYTQELQQRINQLKISFHLDIVEADPVEEIGDITIKDYINAGYRDVQRD